jgi:D-galactarolactone isomerase
MKGNTISRRTFLKGTGLTLASLGGIQITQSFASKTLLAEEITVPCSGGTQRPKFKVPSNACDCHHHIYDPARFAYVPEDKRNQPPGTVDHYRLLQKRLGTTRSVIVQPSAYGLDNSCTLDALQKMGSNTRAVTVIEPTVTDTELKRMQSLGVCGIRINLASAVKVVPVDKIEPLSKRVNELGWHMAFWIEADDIIEIGDLLMRLPTPLVFDHMAHLPQPAGTDHPAYRVVCKLIDKGKTWVKVSGAYLDTKLGPPAYADTSKLAQAFVRYAPERMVWGSDWPHPVMWGLKKPWPDDALLLDLLSEWVPNETVRNSILVENPAKLYGFQKGEGS